MLWRRLDLPGHDAAFLRRRRTGIELFGMTVFTAETATALRYVVRCDAAWMPLEARVDGRHDGEAVDIRVRRETEGGWIMNGIPCPAPAGCTDLDLSFTPATNLLHVRRLALAVGHAAELRSAWLEWPEVRLGLLVQRYRRSGPAEYDYEADLPDGTTFRAVLRVDAEGWVVDYPGLWAGEPAGHRTVPEVP